MKKPKKNPHAAALGALTKGGKKTITPEESQRRVERAAHARLFRWTKKDDVELLAKVDEDARVI
jgi:hypothetical protein